MAETVVKDGLCHIKLASPADGTLEALGYARNSVDPSGDTYMTDVPGDQNGGDEGPPIEIQHMGDIWRVRIELTKFDTAVATKLKARLPGATEGVPATPGTLLFADNKVFRLLLHSTSRPMNFKRAVLRSAVEFNKGTKWQTFSCEFECHKDADGVMYDATTS